MNALIVVDVQNDFLPGGSLGVPDGDQVIGAVNELMPSFDLVVATQDWHPREHLSFAANHDERSVGEVVELGGLEQVLWPEHCVQGTAGAEFASDLHTELFAAIIRKGMNPQVDSYSGFFDNGNSRTTGLAGLLKDYCVSKVTVCGLATDYCVKYTAIDAVRSGFETTIALDACRGVNLNPNDVANSLDEMRTLGIAISE